jgi:peptidoglycan biosynthesis protein MviN/MurJ (putative lipid II flippase)
MEFKRAGGAMLINVPLSASLIYAYGKEGAALGTLIACFVANSLFAHQLLKRLGLAWRRTLAALWPLLLPLGATALGLAVAARAIEPLVIASRWYMAPAALGLYLAGLAVAGFWLWQSGSLDASERAYLASLVRRLLGGRAEFGPGADVRSR